MLGATALPASRPAPSASLEALLLARYTGFAAFLRANGFPYADASTAIQSLQSAGQLDPQVMRWTLRSSLCGRTDEWRRFDELFDSWFLPADQRRRTEVRASGGGKLNAHQPGGMQDNSEGTPLDTGAGNRPDTQGGTSQHGASKQEAYEQADFRHLHEPDAMRALDQLLRRLVKRLRHIQLRRDQESNNGRRLDLARTVRRSVSHGGLPLEPAWRERRKQRPRLVLLLDVSRSMSLYSFFYLRLARLLTGMLSDVHCFMFHTRLTRITQALRDPDPARVRESLYLLSSGWAGGTQIGASLEQFNREYAPKLLHARTCVLVASDGYDTLPAERAANALRAMHRRARSIIWLNPLAGRPGYTPSAACMQAALPFVDRLVPAGNLASLEKAMPDIIRAC